ncbi:rSAM-modified peptide [Flavobacterium sp. FlaQc-47]
MKNTTLKFEDFELEKLSRMQQKTVKGGDDPTEPSIQTGKGATRP